MPSLGRCPVKPQQFAVFFDLCAPHHLRGALCPSRRRPVERSGEAGAYKPREGSELTEHWYQSYDPRHGCRNHKDQDGVAVDAPLVPVRRNLFRPVEALDVDASSLHEVVVDDDDAEERSEESRQAAQEVVDGNRTAVDVPGRDEEGEEGRDQTTPLEVYVLGDSVRQVVCGRDEVGHDVDPDGGDREGQGAYDQDQRVRNLRDQLDRVRDGLAVHGYGARSDNDGDQ